MNGTGFEAAFADETSAQTNTAQFRRRDSMVRTSNTVKTLWSLRSKPMLNTDGHCVKEKEHLTREDRSE